LSAHTLRRKYLQREVQPVTDDLSTGERIAVCRNRAGLTQEEAALAGVSVSLWRKWESGARAVARFSQLVDIA